MSPEWSPLTEELARWRGLRLPLWWRDDDAIAQTPALQRLIELARSCGLPVHVAVIPSLMQPDLTLPPGPTVPVVHGWAHLNHAPDGEKKCEFGANRALHDRRSEAERGLATLRAAMPAAAMFVPPWNRMADDMGEGLVRAGYTMLSGFTPRRAPLAAPGLTRINTHLDPIHWRGDRGLVDPDLLIGQLVQDLADRRHGRTDNEEPYGLLTHHLVHDTAIWNFTETLIRRLLDGPAAPWVAPISETSDEPT